MSASEKAAQLSRTIGPAARAATPGEVMVGAVLRDATDIAVSPARVEGFGLTVAEAMWKGRPVVASRIGGIQDQIVDGESGVLVDPADLAGVGAAIEGLLGDPGAAGRGALDVRVLAVEFPVREQNRRCVPGRARGVQRLPRAHDGVIAVGELAPVHPGDEERGDHARRHEDRCEEDDVH